MLTKNQIKWLHLKPFCKLQTLETHAQRIDSHREKPRKRQRVCGGITGNEENFKHATLENFFHKNPNWYNIVIINRLSLFSSVVM